MSKRASETPSPAFSNGQMLLMVDGMKGFKVHGARANRQAFCLCGGKSKTKKFFITAQDIGKLPIYARVSVYVCQCVSRMNNLALSRVHRGGTNMCVLP